MLTPEQKREMEKILDEMDDRREWGQRNFTSNGDEIILDEEQHIATYRSIHTHACRHCCWFFGSESCIEEDCGKR